MALGTLGRPPEGEALDSAMIGDSVCLAEPKRHGRRYVRLYRDKAGRPFIRNRYKRVRYLKAIRFLTIDGVALNCGAAVLETESA